MHPGRPISRRSLLLGAAGLAGLAVAGACGTGGDDPGQAGRIELEPVDGRVLLAGFAYQGGYLVTGIPQRLTFVVGGPDGTPSAQAPPELTLQLSRNGVDLGDPVVVSRHADGVPLPYFPLTATFAEPGAHLARAEIDGAVSEQSFIVEPASAVALVQVGSALPAVDTPTPAEPRGVDPVCSRTPACPLHDVTLAAALQQGRPLALLVGSPAASGTGLSGPLLELLVEQAESYTAVRFIHAEVYRNATAADAAATSVTPVVGALGLTFEPSLVLADAAGTIVSRLDNVYDRSELRAALDAIAA